MGPRGGGLRCPQGPHAPDIVSQAALLTNKRLHGARRLFYCSSAKATIAPSAPEHLAAL